MEQHILIGDKYKKEIEFSRVINSHQKLRILVEVENSTGTEKKTIWEFELEPSLGEAFGLDKLILEGTKYGVNSR